MQSDDIDYWYTTEKGKHVPVRRGQTPKEALQEAIKIYSDQPEKDFKSANIPNEKKSEDEFRKEQANMSEHSPDWNYNYQKNPGKIAGVKRGAPMKYMEADGGSTNPYYNQDVKNGGALFGYTTNCQTCSVAFEARLRGYDVRALPNNENIYIKILAQNPRKAFVDKATGGQPVEISQKDKEDYDSFFSRTIQKGCRYELMIYRDQRPGHTVCIDIAPSGNIRLCDPQIGKVFVGSSKINDYISSQSAIHLSVFRVDNCDFNQSYVHYILKGK